MPSGGMSAGARKLVAAASVGAAVGLLAAVLAWLRPPALERGEFWSYDARARHGAHPSEGSREIVIVDISDDDFRDVLRNLRLSWPWPRALHGYLVDYCTKDGARAVVFDFVFQDPGRSMAENEEFAHAMRDSGRVVIGLSAPRPTPDASDAPPPPSGDLAAALGTFPTRAEAEAAGLRLSAWDARVFLAAAGAADGPTTVYYGAERRPEDLTALWERLSRIDDLAGLFAPPAPEGAEPPPPASPAPHTLSAAEQAGELTAEGVARARAGLRLQPVAGPRFDRRILEPPLALLGAAAARLGNVVQVNEEDGVLRRYEYLVESDGLFFPSLATAAYLLTHPGVVPELRPGELVLGGRRVPIDEDGRTALRFHGRARAVYPHVGSYDVLQSIALAEEGKPTKLPPGTFKDKYVFVSATARALRDFRASPLSQVHLGAEINANALDNLLSGRFVTRLSRPADAAIAFALALLFAVAVVAVWSWIPSSAAAFAALIGMAAVFVGGYWLLARWLYDARGVWIAVTTPIGGGVASIIAAALVGSSLERRGRRFVQEALGRYTSDALVDWLIAHPEHLSLDWGEQREMTVYFSDIAGFTSFSEVLEPKRLVALLNDYLTHMTDIVLAHGGTIDKYIGDAVMAFWGAPKPDPEHARHAVRCAIAMRRRCEELRPRWQQEYGTTVIARAGVNSGQAVVGNMGSKHKYNYTVMGDMVNLASRLEGANKPYGTVLMISETTHALVKDEVDVRELDFLAVKGKEKPVTVYEVLAEKGATDPTVAEAVRRYHEGLALYRAQKFDEAIAAFAGALTVRPDDSPSRMYVDRCKVFLKEPPGAGWDGVWHMKEK